MGALDGIGGGPTRDEQLAEIRGLFWARGLVVVFGLMGGCGSIVLVGIPLLYAAVLAWRGLDEAAAAVNTGDDARFVGAARQLSSALRITVIWYVAFFVLYFVFYIGMIFLMGAAGALD